MIKTTKYSTWVVQMHFQQIQDGIWLRETGSIFVKFDKEKQNWLFKERM